MRPLGDRAGGSRSPAGLLAAVLLALVAACPLDPAAGAERPGPDNTGVPPGVELTPVEGPLTVTEDGAVLEGLDVEGCVIIEADQVVLRDSRIRCSRTEGENRTHAIRNKGRDALIENVEIDGLGDPRTMGILGSLVTVRRAHIHSVGDGIKGGTRSVYEGNYIHSLATGEGQHNDGIQVSQGRDIVIRGNRIVRPPLQTSAILMKADLGPISEVVIEGNWLEGANYTLYVIGKGPSPRREGSYTPHPTSDVAVRGNRFGRNYKFGILLSRDVKGLTWEGNVWMDTGEAVGPVAEDGTAPAPEPSEPTPEPPPTPTAAPSVSSPRGPAKGTQQGPAAVPAPGSATPDASVPGDGVGSATPGPPTGTAGDPGTLRSPDRRATPGGGSSGPATTEPTPEGSPVSASSPEAAATPFPSRDAIPVLLLAVALLTLLIGGVKIGRAHV